MDLRALRALVGAVALTLGCGDGSATSGARALEGRLLAPCCFNGTLDIHESPLARELRSEIDARLEHGESSEAIQRDFVSRFGVEIVAARTDAPLRALGALALALSGAAGIGLMVAAWRWTERARRVARTEPRATAAASTHADADVDIAMNERLDAELREVD